MITNSQAEGLLQTLTGVQSTDTTNTATLLQFFNDSRRTVANIRTGSWPWLEIQKSVLTTADQEYVEVPNDMDKVVGVRVRVGGTTDQDSTTYIPIMIWDSKKWELVIASRLGSNTYPYYCYQRGTRVLFQPIPSDSSSRVVLIGRRKLTDLNIDDITNITVATATTDSTSVTVSGSAVATWVGRYIRITASNTVNKGDGAWYEIASVTNSTTIVLTKPYQGTSIVAGAAACTIGQITYEPEAYQMAPIYRAVAQYWDLKENMVLSERYWNLYDGGCEIGKKALPAGLIGQMLDKEGDTFEGPYFSNPNMRQDSVNVDSGVPYWLPYQDATGF